MIRIPSSIIIETELIKKQIKLKYVTIIAKVNGRLSAEE